jgi:hypothetical protein
MTDVERPDAYFSCLIRLQRLEDDKRPAWRCSLEIPGTGEVLWFANLTALVAYLEARTRLSRSSAWPKKGPR